MRFIRCARHTNEQNLYAFQYCGNIFYRAFKEIPPGRELLVWYDDKYPQFYGIPLGMQDYEFFRESGKKLICKAKAFAQSCRLNSIRKVLRLFWEFWLGQLSYLSTSVQWTTSDVSGLQLEEKK